MTLFIKRIVKNPLMRSCISLLIGFALWHSLGTINSAVISVTVPLSLYDRTDALNFAAPETVTITLAGKRTYLRSLDTHALAVHINASLLHEGNNPIKINRDTLFLPDEIKLLHYSPSPCVITACRIQA